MGINPGAEGAGFDVVPGGDGHKGRAGEQGFPGAAEALAEAAALHVLPGGGDAAGYGGQGGFAREFCPGDGGQERACVGVARVGEEFLHRGAFDHAAGIHDPHGITVLRDDAEVVRDEQGGRAKLCAQLAQEGEHLVLHGDIQRGGGFIRDDELGPAGEGHGDERALAHAAGKGVRVLADAFARGGKVHVLQQADGFFPRGLVADLAVKHEHLGYLVANALHGVEGLHRLLEDDADAAAAYVAQLALRESQEILPAERDAAVEHLAARLGQQAHEAHRRGAFAATALAHDADAGALRDVEADVVHHGQHAVLRHKGGGQVAHLEQVVGLWGHGVGGRGMLISVSGNTSSLLRARRVCSLISGSIQ